MKKQEDRVVRNIWWYNYSECYWTVCMVVTMTLIFLPKLHFTEHIERYILYFYGISVVSVALKCAIRQMCGFGRKEIIIIKWYFIPVGILCFILQGVLFISSTLLAVRVLMMSLGII